MFQGVRVLIYSGDTDMACNFLGGEWFVEELGRKQITDYKAWFSEDERGIEQVAGYNRQFDGITFATVKVGYFLDFMESIFQTKMIARFRVRDSQFKYFTYKHV